MIGMAGDGMQAVAFDVAVGLTSRRAFSLFSGVAGLQTPTTLGVIGVSSW